MPIQNDLLSKLTQKTSLLVSTMISFVNINTSESDLDRKAANNAFKVKLLNLIILSLLEDVIKW